MLTSAIKKQTSSLLFYFIKSLLYGISNLESWRKKTKKESSSIVSCLTNSPFYMRTLSLNEKCFQKNFHRTFKIIINEKRGSFGS